jgi:hypothetical protein
MKGAGYGKIRFGVELMLSEPHSFIFDLYGGRANV